MSRDSCAAGPRFTKLEGQLQMGRCLSLNLLAQC